MTGGGRRGRARASATPTPAPSSSCSTTHGGFYFLEMNTRLQVEHPVTEMVTGVDLVELADPHRARRALDARSRRSCSRRAATRSSAASTPRIPTRASCRRRAASPACALPSGPGIRDDSGVAAGFEVPIYYDSMISKLVAWGDRAAGDRAHAARARRVRRRRHPDDDAVLPVDARDRRLRRGALDTTMLDAELESRAGRPFVDASPEVEDVAVMAAALETFYRDHASGGRVGPRRRFRLASGGSPGRAAMTLEIEVGRRTAPVLVEREADGRFRVTVEASPERSTPCSIARARGRSSTTTALAQVVSRGAGAGRALGHARRPTVQRCSSTAGASSERRQRSRRGLHRGRDDAGECCASWSRSATPSPPVEPSSSSKKQ